MRDEEAMRVSLWGYCSQNVATRIIVLAGNVLSVSIRVRTRSSSTAFYLTFRTHITVHFPKCPAFPQRKGKSLKEQPAQRL